VEYAPPTSQRVTSHAPIAIHASSGRPSTTAAITGDVVTRLARSPAAKAGRAA
jgi:hypothetical protein